MIKILLQGYVNKDPPAQPKLAVPVSVPNKMYDIDCTKTERAKCIGDFGLIAFYYLLRFGEYTYSKLSERRRTQQFHLRDVTLWCNTERLDPELPLDVLYKRYTAATLNISNQKNGVRAQTIHQEAIFTRYCPIKAIICRIKHIRAHTTNLDTMLGSYFLPGKGQKSIISYSMTEAVRKAAKALHLDRQGLTCANLASHSLRAGGAMALHISKVSDNTIKKKKKLGSWSPDTFLMYIHEQISIFAKGLSKQMSHNVQFHNIAYRPIATIPTVCKL